jgi:hypothetical protein
VAHEVVPALVGHRAERHGPVRAEQHPAWAEHVERDVEAWTARGVRFIDTIRSEEYGKVTVFLDLYGNPWDLIEPPTGMGS